MTVGIACPFPITRYPVIVMAHGGGGRLMHRLIDDVFGSIFSNPALDERHDASVIPLPEHGVRSIAVTTDTYVVRPLFFPGGDIGSLSVYGTVNDLAMAGARPLALTAGFVLEEGFPTADLWRLACSMRAAADEAGVTIAAGDTKVVERGSADGVFINTAGVGAVVSPSRICPASVAAGDIVLLSGDIGRHGIAVMSAREGLQFGTSVQSDCAPLLAPVLALVEAGIEVHCLRDLTRGGLASALVEIAEASGHGIVIDETSVPVTDAVRGACEILGFDPFYVANEGRFIAIVPRSEAEAALASLRQCPVSSGAVAVGYVSADRTSSVAVQTLGGLRPLDMLSGEQLPRIC